MRVSSAGLNDAPGYPGCAFGSLTGSGGGRFARLMAGMIAAYRRWPFRPHCDQAAGRHAWMCLIAALIPGLLLDRGHLPDRLP